MTQDDPARAVELRLRAAVESAPSGLLMTDSQGRIVLVNREVERMFGYAREELLGRPIEVLVPERLHAEHPSFRSAFYSDPRARLMGRGRELHARRKDGSEVPVEIGLTPVVTEEGLFVISSIVDITARLEAETQRRELEGQLRQSQKLEAIGTLAGGIAHDFNNILGAIIGYGELAQREAQSATAAGDIQSLLDAAHRGKRLVERILQFSRRQEPVRRPTSLEHAVEEVAHLLRATLPTTIELRTEFTQQTPRVLADATAVQQVLMNLATNAHHAMPKGGVLGIAVQPHYVRDSIARSHALLREGPYVEVSVSDTGHGIDPNSRDRIFEPFFTTKPPGSGSGLGLAIVHGVMRDHDGAVLVESQLGVGTRFRCLFPALEGAHVEARQAPEAAPRGSGERVLCVDDEPSLATVTRRRLEALGYTVTSVTEPAAALEALKGEEFDLVIADYTMPGMTGLELARNIARERPGLPVVLLTGFVDEIAPDVLRDSGVARVLHKPTTIEELATAVAEILGKRKSS